MSPVEFQKLTLNLKGEGNMNLRCYGCKILTFFNIDIEIEINKICIHILFSIYVFTKDISIFLLTLVLALNVVKLQKARIFLSFTEQKGM